MAKSVPDGWHTVTPRLVVRDPAGLVRFLKKAFGATGSYKSNMPSLVSIGDSIVMVSGVGPRKARPAFLHLYVDDADEMYARALRAGAVSVEDPRDEPYGDRRAMITDPYGNDWQIATVLRRARSRGKARR